ncbi:MAG: ABC transporter permease, partial [Polaromonas sp.]|nr:ABC transporter permease [Polaromonas sp.]
MSTLAASPPIQALQVQRSRGYWTAALHRFLKDPVALGAAAVVLLLVGLAVFGPWLAPADPYQSSMFKRLKPIGTSGFPLGTEELGRDMLS